MCGLPVDRMVSSEAVESELWGRVAKRAGELTVQLIKYQANLTAYNILRGLR